MFSKPDMSSPIRSSLSIKGFFCLIPANDMHYAFSSFDFQTSDDHLMYSTMFVKRVLYIKNFLCCSTYIPGTDWVRFLGGFVGAIVSHFANINFIIRVRNNLG